MTWFCFYSVLPCLLLAETVKPLEENFFTSFRSIYQLGRGVGGTVRKGKHGVLITEWNELIRSLYFAFSKEMLVF